MSGFYYVFRKKKEWVVFILYLGRKKEGVVFWGGLKSVLAGGVKVCIYVYVVG